VARAIVIALHLANTLILTGAASLTAWWSQTDAPLETSGRRGLVALGLLSLVVLVVTSMTGAVTALGDTLFPVDPTLGGGLFDRVRTDLDATQHFLVRLRIIHPIVAVLGGLWLIAYSFVIRARDLSIRADQWAMVLFGLVLAQLAIGFANIALAAPGWMQITHLLFAQLVWVTAVLTTVCSLEAD
jgi:heme A synthase